jgi:hypothetical protein
MPDVKVSQVVRSALTEDAADLQIGQAVRTALLDNAAELDLSQLVRVVLLRDWPAGAQASCRVSVAV